MWRYVHIHGSVFTHVFIYSVSSEDLEAKKPQQQRSHLASRSRFLIIFSNKRNQDSLGEMIDSRPGAGNM